MTARRGVVQVNVKMEEGNAGFLHGPMATKAVEVSECEAGAVMLESESKRSLEAHGSRTRGEEITWCVN